MYYSSEIIHQTVNTAAAYSAMQYVNPSPLLNILQYIYFLTVVYLTVS